MAPASIDQHRARRGSAVLDRAPIYALPADFSTIMAVGAGIPVPGRSMEIGIALGRSHGCVLSLQGDHRNACGECRRPTVISIRHAWAFALAAVAHPALAQAPKAFDLVCAGQTVAAKGETRAVSMHLSVDTRKGRWCYRDIGCPQVLPVVTLNGGRLTLLAAKTQFNEASLDVDLATGAFTRSDRIPARPESASSASGHCDKAPFTPLR